MTQEQHADATLATTAAGRREARERPPEGAPQGHPRPGDRLRLTLEAWGRLGEATAQHEGWRVFVFGGIPGEEVVVEVLKRRREYLAARVVEVVSPSPHRVTPPCPYFDPCTGCQYQHVSYEHQLVLKAQMVTDAFRRVAGLEPPLAPTLPSPHQYGYRNHARFTVGPGGVLGYVNRETRRFVPIGRCLIMHQGINDILRQLQGRCAETTQLSVRYGVNTGQFLVQPSLRNPEVPVPTGQTHYTEALGGRTFRVASPSFFQVNTAQAERLVALVRERLALTGDEVVVDAYAGVGTFAVLLAPYARRVVAIEESPAAVRDAEANAAGLENVRFLLGRTEDVLLTLEERPHAVVLDPPRTGCAPRALEALMALRPSRVVYVSCDPASLARDVKVLCGGPFALVEVQPVDMFPQTHHVECVATLTLREDAAEAPLLLASTSPRRRELLERAGLSFQVAAPAVEEEPRDGETPQALAERLALAKARAVADALRGVGPSSQPEGGPRLVVGADTLVVAPDGRVLGKPRDAAEALDMLRALRGRRHTVVTGVAVVDAATGHARATHRTSAVWMRVYSEEEAQAYVASGEPLDKAGAYAVQDPAFRPASRVEGCLLNVVGLPLCALRELLLACGRWTPPSVVPPECQPTKETVWTSSA